jgi:hypothetical protein
MKILSFLTQVYLITATTIPLPTTYDTSVVWSACNNSFYMGEDQGDCNSCAAVALANALSIRTCMRDGRNVRYSAQRIWDCYGGSCDEGVVMENFLFSIMYGDKKDWVMDYYPKVDVMRESNKSFCVKSAREERIDTVSYHKEWWSALENTNADERNPTETTKSVQSIQTEIMKNGPVIAILRLTHSEMLWFSFWSTNSETKVFHPKTSDASEANNRLHAITLIGWGIDNETNKFYWKILNSFGKTWGKDGMGNIPFGFGTLEHEWYAVYSSPVPCHRNASSSDEACIEAQLTAKTVSYAEDTIFLTEIKVLKKRGNVMDDGSILGLTFLCMFLLSAMVCSFRPAVGMRQQKFLSLMF